MAEVRLEVDLPHPPERVWRALTEARLLTEWFMDADLEAREGTSFTLSPTGLRGFSGQISGEMLELAALRRLVMRWEGQKLHTRVTWELTEIVGGSKLRVLQTGFIGAPATLRRRELRATYTQLFAERLPHTLDRLAAGEVDLGGTASASLRTAVPRQRRARGNAPGRSWSTGRSRWGQSIVAGAAGAVAARGAAVTEEAVASEAEAAGVAAAAGEARSPGDSRSPAVPGPRQPAGEGRAQSGDVPAAPADRRRRRWLAVLPPMRTWLAVAPAWARFVAVGAAACVLAIVVLTALTRAGDGGTGGPPTAQGERGPGTAVQPGIGDDPGPAADPTAGTPAANTGTPRGGPSSEPGAGDGSPGTSPTGDGPVEGTGGPGPEPPELAASWESSGLLLGLLTGRDVAVTVTNPGPGEPEPWRVEMAVGEQEVQNVTGAEHQRSGEIAIFTPLEPGEPAAGEDVQFSFELRGLLGLVASDPSSCTIDGRPCES